GEADAKWGERIVLKVEGEYSEEEKHIINEALPQRLASWEKPKEVVWGAILPRTENGKIKRK
ncbi:MAG: AMP-dependent synthetase, partial [Muribaculaceae bacterium]|nr:AMP-dependent synthetase [Muribaculaceae bacterium]